AWRGRSNGPPAPPAGRRELLTLAALLLFCAVLGVVLIGTLYPMIYGLLGLGRLSVGAPYFNLATLPFGALMLAVVGLATVFSARARRFPALLAHGGVLLFTLGVLASATGREERNVSLAPGEETQLAGYRFRFDDITLITKGNYTAEIAAISVWQGSRQRAQLRPERRFYLARRQQTMEPGIAWTPLRDWYAALGEKTGRERYAVRLYVQTGVRWVWGGGLLMVAGGLLSLRRRRE
ncbi:cytochrome c-type biogenesis CcmF C-terminal domain-containing protein, partial [Pluralibacter gergoviae]